MSKCPALIFTNCTNRKRGVVSDKLQARSLPKATYLEVSREWARRIEAAPGVSTAERLYCGRAVTETLSSARILSAEVVFLSAGLGAVRRDERVPAYNLTSSPGMPDSIDRRLTEPYSSTLWWRALLRARKRIGALAHLIDSCGPALILVVLPASYLHMVREEFEDLSPRIRRALRILGPRRPADVPERLRAHWLPYDARLDSPQSGFNGTTGDFPHRALRHFATESSEGGLRRSLQEHHALVERSLGSFTPYVRRRGATASDKDVLAVIGRLWEKCGGNRTRVLRELRAHSGIACEQNRFRRLADRFEGKR